MAAGEESLGRFIFAQDLTCERDLMDFGRTVREPHHEAFHHLIDEGHLGRDAERSVKLQRADRDVVENLGHLGFDRRDILAHLHVILELIDPPGCA